MKKRDICFAFLSILLLVSFVSAIEVITGRHITGEIITGEATSQSTNVSVTVLAQLANITILKPENKTYLTNDSLLLNFTSTGAQTIFYNLDNGANITITTFTYFNTSGGSHVLNLFAENSDGNVTAKNVTFNINLTRYNVSYEEYKGAKKGASIDFIRFAFEELQNLSNIILENSEYGKISFNAIINVTDDGTNDGLTDLDRNTNISFNRIELNASALPNFNVSSTLILYNLTFTNPRILRDGSVCSNICTKQSYSGGSLIFNVTSFAVYSAEETPAAAGGEAAAGGGGGGGGAAITRAINFEVEPKELNLLIVFGEIEEKEIKVRNKGNNVTIDLEVRGISDIAELDKNKLVLEEKGEESVILKVKSLSSGIRAGRIIFKSGEIEKEVFVLINVRSEKKLFDVSLTIPDRYRTIGLNQDLKAFVSLVQVGEPFETDVSVTYSIMDFDGNVVDSVSETLYVYQAKSFVREFPISKFNLRAGEYIVGIEVAYPGGFASSSAHFTISEKRADFRFIAVIVLGIFVIFVIIMYIIKYIRVGRHIKPQTKLR